jgi:N-acetylneuraminic acid mutarotase
MCALRKWQSTVAIALPWLLVDFSGKAQTEGGSWQTLAPMPLARQELATAVLNGKIYVIAGYDGIGRSTNNVQVYNPATNTWSSASPNPIFNNHNAAAVAGGRLYSFGGLSSQAFVYNPVGNSWSAVASMHFQHGNTAAAGVINEKIYVAGGTKGTQSLPNLEVYNSATNTWTLLASMKVARNHCAGAFIDGKFYVVGGRGSTAAPTALEVYDPQSNTWSTRAPMPTGRSGIAAAAVNGELYVFGGEIPNLHGAVEVYNPTSNSWRRLPNMPTPRHGIWASVIGTKIYIPGGGVEQNIAPTNINSVFTVATKATFANISSRAKVQTGNDVVIGGFIITGDRNKRLIVRVIGPSLPVPGKLADPALSLYHGAGQPIAANDNWQNAPNRQEIIDSAFAPPNNSEAAILTTLPPGPYTAIVRGVNNSTGIALVEVYDLESAPDSMLGNISTRALVQTGNNVLIGGFIATGAEPRRLIVRALGPSLPLSGTLANPNLAVYDAQGALIAANDNWRNVQEAKIMATHLAPGNDLESAVVLTLAPGPYTAIVSGSNATTGVALAEIYALE